MTSMRRRAVVGFALLALLVGGASLAWACTPRAAIEVSPGAAVAGDQVTVVGYSFVDGGRIEIYWEPTGAMLAQTTGPNFSRSVTVPDTAGTHTLYAVGYDTDGSVAKTKAAFAFTVETPTTPDAGSGDTTDGSNPPPADNSNPGQDTNGDNTGGGTTTDGSTGGGTQDQATAGGGTKDQTTDGGTTGNNSVSTDGGTTGQAGGQNSNTVDGSTTPAPDNNGGGTVDPGTNDTTNAGGNQDVAPTMDTGTVDPGAGDKATSGSGTTDKTGANKTGTDKTGTDNTATSGDTGTDRARGDTSSGGNSNPGTPDQGTRDASRQDTGSRSSDSTSGGSTSTGGQATSDSTDTTDSTDTSAPRVFAGSEAPSQPAADQVGTQPDQPQAPLSLGEGLLTPFEFTPATPPAANTAPEAPTAGTADDGPAAAWNGLQPDDAPSFNAQLSEEATNGGGLDGVTAGAGLLAVGLVALFAGFAVAGLRRRKVYADNDHTSR